MKKINMALLTLSGSLLLAACQPAKEDVNPLTDEQAEAWVIDFSERLVANEINVAEGITELEEHLGRVDDKEFSQALEMFLYILEVQVDRYNTLLSSMAPEIDAIFEAHEDITFESDEGWKSVTPGLVTGLRKEVAQQPLKWVQDKEGNIVVEVDFDKLEEQFAEGITELLTAKIELSEYRLNYPEYDYENFHLDFANIWKRLDALSEYKEKGTWDSTLDDQEYYLTNLLYGFGEGSMNFDNGMYNDKALEAMEAVANENKDHPNAKNMLQIVALIKEEKSSNEKVLEFTNDLLNEQFKDYLKEVEESLEEAEAEGTNSVDDLADDADPAQEEVEVEDVDVEGEENEDGGE